MATLTIKNNKGTEILGTYQTQSYGLDLTVTSQGATIYDGANYFYFVYSGSGTYKGLALRTYETDPAVGFSEQIRMESYAKDVTYYVAEAEVDIVRIDVKGKIATLQGQACIVCGNSDYLVRFTFDDAWGKDDEKTARFVYRKLDGIHYVDVPFTGTDLFAPKLSGVDHVLIGVYVQDLSTSTPARVPCRYSVLCQGGTVEGALAPSQYDELLAKFTELEAKENARLPAPILALSGEQLIVSDISPKATRVVFSYGGTSLGVSDTGGASSLVFDAPKDGITKTIAAKVIADGFEDSPFSNTVVYTAAVDFVSTRRNLSRVFFCCQNYPYRDINNRVTLSSSSKVSEYTNDGLNTYKCLRSQAGSVDWWNEEMGFRRSAYDPFPRKPITIEMWVKPSGYGYNESYVLFSSESGWDGSNIPYNCRIRQEVADETHFWIYIDTCQNGASETYGAILCESATDYFGWTHLVVTQEEGSGGSQKTNKPLTKIYRRGELIGSTEALHWLYDCMTTGDAAKYTFFLPCGSPGYCYSGYIDSFGIYDFAWNEAQVKAVYEIEKPQG